MSQTIEAVFGPQLRRESVRIGFLDQVAIVPALDLELVDLALTEVRDEDLPDARPAPVAHRVTAAVPMVEIPDHADPLRIRGPHREMDAPEAGMGPQVGTEPLVIPIMRPFAEQVQIEVSQDRPECVGIDELPRIPFMILHAQPVGERFGAIGEDGREEAVRVDRSIATRSPGSPRSGPRPRPFEPPARTPGSPRSRSPRSAGQLVQAQDRIWVPVVAMHDQFGVVRGRRGYRHRLHRHDC